MEVRVPWQVTDLDPQQTVGWRPESVGGACYSTNYRPGSYLPGAQITRVRSYSFPSERLRDLIDFLYLRA